MLFVFLIFSIFLVKKDKKTSKNSKKSSKNSKKQQKSTKNSKKGQKSLKLAISGLFFKLISLLKQKARPNDRILRAAPSEGLSEYIRSSGVFLGLTF